MFYSISNCQPGLRGRLVRQLPDQAGGRGALARGALARRPSSPSRPRPGFGRWLDRVAADPAAAGLDGTDTAALARSRAPGWHRDPPPNASARSCWAWRPHYYLAAKGPERQAARPGGPLPPRQRRPPGAPQLARRHLGEGPARGRRADGQLPLRPALRSRPTTRPSPTTARSSPRTPCERQLPDPHRPARPGDPPMSDNLFDDLPAQLSRRPRRTALHRARPTAACLSYADLLDLSGRMANALIDAGRQARRPRRRPGREKRRGADGLPRQRCAPGPSTCRSTPPTRAGEVRYFLGDAEPTVFVCRPELRREMRALAGELGVPRVETLGAARRTAA